MTTLRIGAFSGEIPRRTPRLLPDGFAQAAYNVRLDDGALTPMRWARYADHLDGGEDYKTIYKRGEQWLAWDKVVNVVPGPVATDRLYITGDGAPKIMVDDLVIPLALPPPPNALTAALTGGTVDPAVSSSVVYAFTWVTAFDEESEPSALSNEVVWSPGCTITLTGWPAVPAGRAINRVRIYRSPTSATGATGLYFLAERPAVLQTAYDDHYGDTNEAIPSVSYNPPPDDLAGLTSLPNGMMAAFSGKELCFCEPYRPHAWPEQYRLAVDYPIVGLCAFGSALAVLTTGQPYVVNGTAPENMVMERLEVNLPCVNPRSIVDLGYAGVYASHAGLVSISSSGANLVTGELFTRERWVQMNPYSMVAGQYNGRYMASYAYTDTSGAEQRGTLILDLTGSQPFLIRGNDDADAMYYDVPTGSLYLLRNGADIYQWDDQSQPNGEFYWRSKQHIFSGPLSFSCILVEGLSSVDPTLTEEEAARRKAKAEAQLAANRALMDDLAAAGEIAGATVGLVTFAGSLIRPVNEVEDSMAVTVWADGRRVATITSANQIVRLPAVLGTWWEIEVRSNMPITALSLAQSPMELSA